METFINIVTYDYLQRTRSYAFLIILCISLALAYTFVPEPGATYSTIEVSGYAGTYNAAWFGYVTAIMSSIFLSLIGFYLINSGIAADRRTKVGQIIAATRISNLRYLLAKALSNFLVLMTIVCIIFGTSIVLFLLYNDGSPFELDQFVKPYLVITTPTLFFISALAVFLEVCFKRYTVLHNIAFFALFASLVVYTPKTESQFKWDVLGSKIVTHQMEETVRPLLPPQTTPGLTIGYVLKGTKKIQRFHFQGVTFPLGFIMGRLLWMALGITLIVLASAIFDRFNMRERVPKKSERKILPSQIRMPDIKVGRLPSIKVERGIFPLLRAESILLIRKGKKWLWALNAAGMLLLAFLPLELSHQMILPIVWFLQVGRLSDLTAKEAINHMGYSTNTSYRPLGRLLLSQCLAGMALVWFLALPLILRLIGIGEIIPALSVVLGGAFIVLLATTLGILTRGKKLFEVVFFLITYANINAIPFLDYFGGCTHSSFYPLQLSLWILCLGSVAAFARHCHAKDQRFPWSNAPN
ncbi:MAG: ABC transporter permease [Flavobacteriaceae bacterium]